MKFKFEYIKPLKALYILASKGKFIESDSAGITVKIPFLMGRKKAVFLLQSSLEALTSHPIFSKGKRHETNEK